jgi:hypothetical protein
MSQGQGKRKQIEGKLQHQATKKSRPNGLLFG